MMISWKGLYYVICYKTEYLSITDDDDLFGSKPPAVPEEPVKPKKPVGGVSMFGGMDPMSALKKKQEKATPQKG